jgi:hypothetical protein
VNGLCVEARWRASGLTLQLRDCEGRTREWPLEVGEEMAVATAGRRCIGARLPGRSKLVPCPESASLQRGSQCQACFTRSAVLACLRCTGERCGNPLRRGRCIQPANHYLYLGLVAPGLSKVGVARVERLSQRLGEQGLRQALLLARLDGREVRLWEHRIAQLGIRDRLPLAEKLAGWCDTTSPERLREELDNLAARVARRLPGPFLDEPIAVELPPLAALERLPRLVRGTTLSVRGQLLALYGTTLLVELEEGETVAVDGDALVGLQLREVAVDEQITGQLALLL